MNPPSKVLLPTRHAVRKAFRQKVARTEDDYDILGRAHELISTVKELRAAETHLHQLMHSPDVSVAELIEANNAYFKQRENLSGLVLTIDLEVEERLVRQPPGAETHSEGLGTIIFRMALLSSRDDDAAVAQLEELSATYDRLRIQVESGYLDLPKPMRHDYRLGDWPGFRCPSTELGGLGK